MSGETSVTVQTGETVGACLVIGKLDGVVVFAGEVHWSLAPAEFVDLLRAHITERADALRASLAAQVSANPHQPDHRLPGPRLMA